MTPFEPQPLGSHALGFFLNRLNFLIAGSSGFPRVIVPQLLKHFANGEFIYFSHGMTLKSRRPINFIEMAKGRYRALAVKHHTRPRRLRNSRIRRLHRWRYRSDGGGDTRGAELAMFDLDQQTRVDSDDVVSVHLCPSGAVPQPHAPTPPWMQLAEAPLGYPPAGFLLEGRSSREPLIEINGRRPDLSVMVASALIQGEVK